MKNEAQYMLSICLIFWPILTVHMLIGFMLIKKKRVPDLITLKHFEFETKIDIGYSNSSSSDDEKEDVEDNVKQIGNSEWC